MPKNASSKEADEGDVSVCHKSEPEKGTESPDDVHRASSAPLGASYGARGIVQHALVVVVVADRHGTWAPLSRWR